MNFRLTLEAVRELEAAAAYYDSCSAELADDFLAEFELTVGRVVAFPHAWTQLSTATRRCLFNRFPYCIVYSVEYDQIQILAVMHLQRKPKKW